MGQRDFGTFGHFFPLAAKLVSLQSLQPLQFYVIVKHQSKSGVFPKNAMQAV